MKPLKREPKRDTLIRTYSGLLVDPLKPEPILIADIAHALSLLCRYGGHVIGLRSVAQHSIEVAWLAWNATHDIAFTFAALMHDASEAYMQDIVSPLKRKLRDYRRAEHKLQRRLACSFGITLTRAQSKLLGTLDRQARMLEMPEGTTDSLTATQARRSFMTLYNFLQRQLDLPSPPAALQPQYFSDVNDLFADLLRA